MQYVHMEISGDKCSLSLMASAVFTIWPYLPGESDWSGIIPILLHDFKPSARNLTHNKMSKLCFFKVILNFFFFLLK